MEQYDSIQAENGTEKMTARAIILLLPFHSMFSIIIWHFQFLETEGHNRTVFAIWRKRIHSRNTERDDE